MDAAKLDAFFSSQGGGAAYDAACVRTLMDEVGDSVAYDALARHGFARVSGHAFGGGRVRFVQKVAAAARHTHYLVEGRSVASPQARTLMVLVTYTKAQRTLVFHFIGYVEPWDYPVYAPTQCSEDGDRHVLPKAACKPVETAQAPVPQIEFDLSVLADLPAFGEETEGDRRVFEQHMHALLECYCVNRTNRNAMVEGQSAGRREVAAWLAYQSSAGSLPTLMIQPAPRRYQVLLGQFAYRAKANMAAHNADFVVDMLCATFQSLCVFYYSQAPANMEYLRHAAQHRLPSTIWRVPASKTVAYEVPFGALFAHAPRTARVAMDNEVRVKHGKVLLSAPLMCQAVHEMYRAACVRLVDSADETKHQALVDAAIGKQLAENQRRERYYVPDSAAEPQQKRKKVVDPVDYKAIESSLGPIDHSKVQKDAMLRVGLITNKPGAYFGVRSSVRLSELSEWGAVNLEKFSLLIPQIVFPTPSEKGRHWKYPAILDLDAWNRETLEEMKTGQRPVLQTMGPRNVTFAHAGDIKKFFLKECLYVVQGDPARVCAESLEFCRLFDSLRILCAALRSYNIQYVCYYSAGGGCRCLILDKSLWVAVDDGAKYGHSIVEKVIRPFIEKITDSKQDADNVMQFVDGNVVDIDKGIKNDCAAHPSTGLFCVDMSHIGLYSSLEDYFSSEHKPCLLERERADPGLLVSIHIFWKRFIPTTVPDYALLDSDELYVPLIEKKKPSNTGSGMMLRTSRLMPMNDWENLMDEAKEALPTSGGNFKRLRLLKYDGLNRDLAKQYRLLESTARQSSGPVDRRTSLWDDAKKKYRELNTASLATCAEKRDPIQELKDRRLMPLCMVNAERIIETGDHLRYHDRNSYGRYMYDLQVSHSAINDIEELASHMNVRCSANLSAHKQGEHARAFGEIPDYFDRALSESKNYWRRQGKDAQKVEKLATGSLPCGKLCSTNVMPSTGGKDNLIQCPYAMAHRGYMGQGDFEDLLKYSGVSNSTNRGAVLKLAEAGKYAEACTKQLDTSRAMPTSKKAHGVVVRHPKQYSWLAADIESK